MRQGSQLAGLCKAAVGCVAVLYLPCNDDQIGRYAQRNEKYAAVASRVRGVQALATELASAACYMPPSTTPSSAHLRIRALQRTGDRLTPTLSQCIATALSSSAPSWHRWLCSPGQAKAHPDVAFIRVDGGKACFDRQNWRDHKPTSPLCLVEFHVGGAGMDGSVDHMRLPSTLSFSHK